MTPNVSSLELYVRAFVNQQPKSVVGVKNLQRAKALINMRLTGACCDGDETVTTLYTTGSGPFIKGFEIILNSMPIQGNKASLTRTVTLIERALGACCE